MAPLLRDPQGGDWSILDEISEETFWSDAEAAYTFWKEASALHPRDTVKAYKAFQQKYRKHKPASNKECTEQIGRKDDPSTDGEYKEQAKGETTMFELAFLLCCEKVKNFPMYWTGATSGSLPDLTARPSTVFWDAFRGKVELADSSELWPQLKKPDGEA